jgi:hypothetical protein
MSKTDLLGDIPEGVLKQNVMKDEFGWEIPIEMIPLPSRGAIYNPDSTLFNRETLKIKAMTAREEDILASPAFHKEGTALTHLIKSCLIDKTIDPEALITGDRVALMVGIRVTGYGPEYHARSTCQSCGTVNDFAVDLSTLPIKRLTIDPTGQGKNEFSFTLPVTKKKVIFKYITAREERERNTAIQKQSRIMGTKIQSNVTSFLENSIVSVDGVTDRMKIKHFVMNMPAFDSRKLRKYINDNEPGMDLKCSFTCKNCSAHNESSLPITAEFFWPTK